MKQKIVIEFRASCEKCRRKVLKTASGADGVVSVGLEGEEQDKVVVIGERVDAASLTKKLRKKLECTAQLLTVEDLEAKQLPETKPDPDPVFVPSFQGPPYEFRSLAYDPPNSSPCVIM
ncbi:Heavy metal-associated isoprenylated plant protein 41 [Euphorbia peplus]|nr:Heavy metal-associated isoprenylated plant protein 41 [Euphorbia peplus]